MSLNMDNAIIDKEPRECTCIGDVIRLLEVKGSFSLYQAPKLDTDSKVCGTCYFIIGDGDEFPIVITKKRAMEIIKNPKDGCNLAMEYFYGRYR